ncbi:hypothetical protein FACS189418_8630 [Clostridia bacterium]|nr:hypothetical protein FACS189418_8630 [Clostridia bacterium]
MFFNLIINEEEEVIPEAKSELQLFQFLKDKPKQKEWDYDVDFWEVEN